MLMRTFNARSKTNAPRSVDSAIWPVMEKSKLAGSRTPPCWLVRAPFTHSHLPRHARVQHVPAFPALGRPQNAVALMLLLLENEKKTLQSKANSRFKVRVRVHQLVRQLPQSSINGQGDLCPCNDCCHKRGGKIILRLAVSFFSLTENIFAWGKQTFETKQLCAIPYFLLLINSF